ncbi:hypothetical protein DYB32_006038, partial [Aphanomyces invadans]
VGGVESGEDSFNMIMCGAQAVQVGTCHWIEGPKCFDRIASELMDLMTQKGYNAVDEFRGKLQPWSKEGAAKSRDARKAGGANKSNAVATVVESKADSASLYAVIIVLLAVIAALLVEKFNLTKP